MNGQEWLKQARLELQARKPRWWQWLLAFGVVLPWLLAKEYGGVVALALVAVLIWRLWP